MVVSVASSDPPAIFVRAAITRRTVWPRTRHTEICPADMARSPPSRSFKRFKSRIDIMEWAQRLSDKCKYRRGRCSHGRYELFERRGYELYSCIFMNFMTALGKLLFYRIVNALTHPISSVEQPRQSDQHSSFTRLQGLLSCNPPARCLMWGHPGKFACRI